MAITLSGRKDRDITIVSNIFIDEFMPHANGTCVKVYLYLLRCLSDNTPARDLSVAAIADFLGDTEGDVLRAFSWLESQGLIQLTRSADQSVTGICIQEFSAPQTSAASAVETPNTASDMPAAAETATKDTAAPVMTENRARLEIPTYSRKQIQALSENEEVRWIMSIAERYLERLLNPADIQLIIYLYESLNFPADLILHLYEYCASRDKKNPSYIQAVAISWAEQGIRTVEEAEAASARYNANYQAVARVFGLNRMPGTAEQQYIDRWSGTLGFSLDIIEEACNRSLLATQRPDFKYADKILENWHKKGVKTRQDIAKADQLHNQNAVKSTHSNNAVKNTSNRFNAFPQRTYSGEDFSSMEQRLLNRQGS